MDGRRQKVLELLDSLVEVDPPGRMAQLDRLCGEDHELRAEVEELLAALDLAEDFLEDPILLVANWRPTRLFGSSHPRSIGDYRIDRTLSDGENSVVYLADREDAGIQRRVALKVLKGGVVDDQIIARFDQERRIVAALKHPNIAHLLDVGSTATGRPYFVMEHVDGIRIDSYCNKRRLAIEQRLALFQKVCSAVDAAHRALVVHRDLKPSNILVTEEGEPKLLDFGIAKLLDPAFSPENLDPTATVVRLMTPRYASPEQIRGEPITTASDVYSLGVVLYELLTGARPYPLGGLGVGEMERLIEERTPTQPSAAVRPAASESERVGDSVAGVHFDVPISRDRLTRRLKGDLDTIMLKALRKEPERRYGSARELADDLRRHLARQPVVARRDTVAYRAGKFLRRHTVAVAAALAVVASLTGGLIVAARQAAVARAERIKAEQVSDFLSEIFTLAGPLEARGGEITAREILDRGAARVRELSDQPEVQANLMNTIGNVYIDLGIHDSAAALHEQALTIRRAEFGEIHRDVAQSLHNLARARQRQGRYDEAERLNTAALAVGRKTHGAVSAPVAQTLGNLANLYYRQGRYEEAERLLREVVELKRQIQGDDHREVASALNNLAVVLHTLGDLEQAERLHREELAIWRRLGDEEHPRVAQSLHNLATILHERGRYDEAIVLHRQVLDRKLEVFGATHPSVATSLGSLGRLLVDIGEIEQAEELLTEAVRVNSDVFGDSHPRVAIFRHNLATALHVLQRLDEAEVHYRKALDAFGDDHPNAGPLRVSLAGLILERGDLEAAENLYVAGLDQTRNMLGEQHLLTAVAYSGLARLRTRQGNEEAGRLLYRKALGILRATLSPGDVRLCTPLEGLGMLHTEQGQAAEAEPLLREAVGIRRSVMVSEHWLIAASESALGHCLSRLERFEEAEALLVESHAILNATWGSEDRRTRRARDRVVELYIAWDRPDEAARYSASDPTHAE